MMAEITRERIDELVRLLPTGHIRSARRLLTSSSGQRSCCKGSRTVMRENRMVQGLEEYARSRGVDVVMVNHARTLLELAERGASR